MTKPSIYGDKSIPSCHDLASRRQFRPSWLTLQSLLACCTAVKYDRSPLQIFDSIKSLQIPSPSAWPSNAGGRCSLHFLTSVDGCRWTIIGVRTLRYLGHLARKPQQAIERRALFSWLQPESALPAGKRGHQLRHFHWKLLEQLRPVAQKDAASWPSRWIALAQEDEGRTWSRLIQEWQKLQRETSS